MSVQMPPESVEDYDLYFDDWEAVIFDAFQILGPDAWDMTANGSRVSHFESLNASPAMPLRPLNANPGLRAPYLPQS